MFWNSQDLLIGRIPRHLADNVSGTGLGTIAHHVLLSHPALKLTVYYCELESWYFRTANSQEDRCVGNPLEWTEELAPGLSPSQSTSPREEPPYSESPPVYLILPVSRHWL